MNNTEVLNVFLHSKEIGSLTHLPDKRVAFAFKETYIQDSGRKTLSLSFKDKRF